jgi:hypothetical protein
MHRSVTVLAVSRLEVVGERDGWRCWLCDEPVDPEMSVNDPRGPSIDTRITDRRAKKNKGKAAPVDRLAHRGCNTGKGSVKPVVEWSEHLFVADPAVIITSVERLQRKGGREVMARCPGHEDAQAAADWLVDRVSRLEPDLALVAAVESGGGQYLVILRTA